MPSQTVWFLERVLIRRYRRTDLFEWLGIFKIRCIPKFAYYHFSKTPYLIPKTTDNIMQIQLPAMVSSLSNITSVSYLMSTSSFKDSLGSSSKFGSSFTLPDILYVTTHYNKSLHLVSKIFKWYNLSQKVVELEKDKSSYVCSNTSVLILQKPKYIKQFHCCKIYL